MAHADARTIVYARKLFVARVRAGHRPGEVAKQLGVSRQTVYKWPGGSPPSGEPTASNSAVRGVVPPIRRGRYPD
jgi:transposase